MIPPTSMLALTTSKGLCCGSMQMPKWMKACGDPLLKFRLITPMFSLITTPRCRKPIASKHSQCVSKLKDPIPLALNPFETDLPRYLFNEPL